MSAYDVIVVGGRCAGSPSGMLLARAGMRVLLIDRASFPSDTISGHLIKPAGVGSLKRWGLLDKLIATGCPPIRHRHVQFGEQPYDMSAPSAGAMPPLAPRRFVLDELLVDAARSAGAEIREGVTVTDLLWRGDRVVGVATRDRNGATRNEHAEIVIGADGRNSLVAHRVDAPVYADIETVSIGYYAYWSDFPAADGIEIYFNERRLVGLFPTHHDRVVAFVQLPVGERSAFKTRLKANYLDTLRSIKPVAERLADARLAERIRGMAELPTFFRRPFGHGWALVGDAGHHKDPLVARGISDAWRDSQLLTDALVTGWGNDHALQEALAHYQHTRDTASSQVSKLNARLARLDAPLQAMAALWAQLAAAERAGDELLVDRPTGTPTNTSNENAITHRSEERAAFAAHR
jgi:flavin-dependent dehydrogenase